MLFWTCEAVQQVSEKERPNRKRKPKLVTTPRRVAGNVATVSLKDKYLVRISPSSDVMKVKRDFFVSL